MRLALIATHGTCRVCCMRAVSCKLCSATAIERASCTTGARAAGKSATHGCDASSTADAAASQAAPSHAARSADRGAERAPNWWSLHAACRLTGAMVRAPCAAAVGASTRTRPARRRLHPSFAENAQPCRHTHCMKTEPESELLRSLSTCGACSLASQHQRHERPTCIHAASGER